jgi:anaphase-promoting complex subunit 10
VIFLGFGVDQLRDDCMDTYWQSDGQLPHLVNIQFRRKTTVHDICIFTDYKLDESYTPSRQVCTLDFYFTHSTSV